MDGTRPIHVTLLHDVNSMVHGIEMPLDMKNNGSMYGTIISGKNNKKRHICKLDRGSLLLIMLLIPLFKVVTYQVVDKTFIISIFWLISLVYFLIRWISLCLHILPTLGLLAAETYLYQL